MPRKEGQRPGGTEGQKDGMMEHCCHEHKDGSLARDEGVTEKKFARGMGQTAVRSWQQQASQTGRRARSPFMAAATSLYTFASDFRKSMPKHIVFPLIQ